MSAHCFDGDGQNAFGRCIWFRIIDLFVGHRFHRAAAAAGAGADNRDFLLEFCKRIHLFRVNQNRFDARRKQTFCWVRMWLHRMTKMIATKTIDCTNENEMVNTKTNEVNESKNKRMNERKRRKRRSSCNWCFLFRFYGHRVTWMTVTHWRCVDSPPLSLTLLIHSFFCLFILFLYVSCIRSIVSVQFNRWYVLASQWNETPKQCAANANGIVRIRKRKRKCEMRSKQFDAFSVRSWVMRLMKERSMAQL